MPAAKASTTPIRLDKISSTPTTSISSSESRASSSSETSWTSTAASTASRTISPPLSGNPICPHHATTPGAGIPDISSQHSPRPNAPSVAWCRYIFFNLPDRFRRVQAATKATFLTGFHQTILATPNSTTTPRSSQHSQASSSISGDVNQPESPPASMSAPRVQLLKRWWNKLKENGKFKDRMGGTGGVATLLITIFGLVYYAHRTDKLARWTAAKDYLEQCRNELSANLTTPQCRAALTKHLLPPPYQPDNFYTSTTKRDRLPLEPLWSELERPSKEQPSDLKSILVMQSTSFDTLYHAIPPVPTIIVAATLCGLCLFLWRLYSPAKAQRTWRRKVVLEDSPVKSADPPNIIRKPLIRDTGIRRRRIFQLESEDASEEEEHYEQPQEYEVDDGGTSVPTDGFKARESDYIALRNAMQRGDVTGLKALLDFCYDPEARDADGSPILHFFATHRCPQVDNESQIAMLDLLFDYGAQPNTVDVQGRNVLCFARTTPDVIVDGFLLSRMVDVNHRDGISWTPTNHAVRYQDLARLKLFLEMGATYSTRDNYELIYDLCYFAGPGTSSSLSDTAKENEERTKDCLKLLLNCGLDSIGCCSLHHAAEKGHNRVIKTLHGFKGPKTRTTKSSTRCGRIEIWDNLHPLSEYLLGPPLDLVVRAGQLDATSHLLDNFRYITPASRRARAARPEALLMLACSRAPDVRNYTEMIQLLASRSSAIHWPCLAMAAYHVSQDAVRILLHHGADVNNNFIMSSACSSRVDDQKREQPLIPIMFQREREAVIELLMEAGLPLNSNHIAPSPLQVAAGMHPASALLRRGCAEPISGFNLQLDEDLCRYLLKRGADPLRVDSSGGSLLFLETNLDKTLAQIPEEQLGLEDDEISVPRRLTRNIGTENRSQIEREFMERENGRLHRKWRTSIEDDEIFASRSSTRNIGTVTQEQLEREFMIREKERLHRKRRTIIERHEIFALHSSRSNIGTVTQEQLEREFMICENERLLQKWRTNIEDDEIFESRRPTRNIGTVNQRQLERESMEREDGRLLRKWLTRLSRNIKGSTKGNRKPTDT